MLQEIRGRLYVLRGHQATMTQEHATLRRSMRPVRQAEDAVEAEIKRLLAERKRLRIDRPKWLDVTLAKRLDQLRPAAGASRMDPKELQTLLTLLFSKVVIDWPEETLCFHWKHGGQSTVKAAMKPLRDVASLRRSPRPRFQPGERAPPLPVVPR